MADSLSQRITSRLPGLNPLLVEEHLRRLDERYLQRFTEEEIVSHLEGIAVLVSERPVKVISASDAQGAPTCTIVAFDHQGAFSLISGVLSAMGFDIRSGDIFTWGQPDFQTPRDLFLRRRRIIDEFSGTIAQNALDSAWRETLSRRLEDIFLALEQGGTAAHRARQIVNEMAAEKLAGLRVETGGVLYPVRIELDSSAARTRMYVKTQDTPFFLYTFSTALSLQDVSIEHVTIRTEEGKIEDQFEFVDESGNPVSDQARLDSIKLSVLLTKQFTSFLGSASDPLAALLRFEQLVKDVV
ncbi:MAG TPA: hypothetical protein VMM82_02660, partial [Spirochaetia bacterium]|nr:hypothetical protein [Spirochaetia bacterium]